MCGLYLLVIMTANFYFGQSFLIYELNWEASFPCFVAFIWSALFTIFSPLCHAFVSFCRLMVAVNPIETKVKDPYFVSKIIFCMLPFVIMFIITFSIPVKMFSDNSVSNFCTALIFSPKSGLLFSDVLMATLSFQIIMVVVIGTTYTLLFRQMKKNQESMEQSRSKSHSNVALFVQVIFTIVAQALNWIPCGIINLTFLISGKVSPYIMVMSILLPSANSLITPVLLILVVVRHK